MLSIRKRVAHGLAEVETPTSRTLEERFVFAMQNGFIPAEGSSAAVMNIKATLINCYSCWRCVSEDKDGKPSIYKALRKPLKPCAEAEESADLSATGLNEKKGSISKPAADQLYACV